MMRHILLLIVLLVSFESHANRLIQAILSGDRFQVEALLDARVSPNVRLENGDVPLILAVYLQRSDLVFALLLAGADPDVRDIHGNPVLILALRDRDIVEHLLLAGANPILENWQHQTARMLLEMDGERGPLWARISYAETQWWNRYPVPPVDQTTAPMTFDELMPRRAGYIGGVGRSR